MFGYAEIEGTSPGRDAARAYAESLARSHASVESGDDCVGGSQLSTTVSMVTVFLEGRPYWSEQAAAPASVQSIVDAYLQSGCNFLGRLNGSFSIAIFDRRTRELTLAIDRMGIATMAWATDQHRIVFSTSPANVARRPNANTQIRHQAIYDYFFFHMIPGPDSIYSGVTKLGAGSAITFNRSGRRLWNYWVPSFDRSQRVGFDELKARVHAALRESVRAQYSGPRTGAFLSGGIDSSTVTGFLTEISGEPAQTFSIGFGVESFDELEYARITNRHFGSVPHEYNVSPNDIVQAIPVVAAAFDEPFGNSSAIPTFACARFAKSLGMDRLLAGDGGDEIFAGNERYAKQQVFEIFKRLPSPLRAVVKSGVQQTIGPDNPITMLRKLRSYVDQASIDLPERYESWNFVYREGGTVMFDENFMNGIDSAKPIRQMKLAYDSTPGPDLLDHMLYYDWKFTLADNDLRKVVTTCDAAGIEVGFPMLDNRVVDASIAVPSELKMNRLELRSFFKHAMEGFLPEAVLKKTKHGFGLPFGQWLKTDKTLADLVYGSLSDLKKRAIVRSSFLDRLIEEHRGGHASYYGYVIWDLVILEEWFKRQSAMGGTTERTSSRGA